MKILKLKINSFGNLKNKDIELDEGINIVYGKNEAGKSTLLKFITGMFYGLSKNKNGRFISDYDRYTPWKENEFSGKITYKLDDETKYEVFREFKKKNPHIYNEYLEDISSNFNIDKSLGNKFFYDQTKVDEKLFLSTIASMQEEVKLEEKDQNTLIQKISNIASTGEDNVSFQKIMNKLNKKQIEEIGTSRSQDRPINVVKKRMEEIQVKKEEIGHSSTNRNELEEQQRLIEEQIKEEENKLQLLRDVRRLQEEQNFDRQKLKINENVVSEYYKKIEELQENEEGNVKNTNEQQNLMKVKKSKLHILNILGILLCIFVFVSIFIIKNNTLTIINVLLVAIWIVYTIYKNHKSKSKLKKAEQNKVNNGRNKNEIEVLKSSIQNLKKQTEDDKLKLDEQYKTRIEKIRNDYLGIIPIKTIDELLEKTSIQYEINVLQNKISEDKLNLHTTSIDVKNILQEAENLAQLEEEYADLEEQYNEMTKTTELIDLVKEEIEKAYDTMKKEVTPKFTTNLSKTIEAISNGKYKSVQLDEQKGMVVEIDNGNYIQAKNLSVGTIDQLYLSLRIGACREISLEKLPIILDETFAYWDNDRLENIFKFLNKEFSDYQVIILSCTNREDELLNKLKIKHKLINL